MLGDIEEKTSIKIQSVLGLELVRVAFKFLKWFDIRPDLQVPDPNPVSETGLVVKGNGKGL